MVDVLRMQESEAPCEVHDWPTDGMAGRLVVAMIDGVAACRACIQRAQADADAKVAGSPFFPRGSA